MRDCPVDELCVHILVHQNPLHRAGLLLTPRYISQGVLLHHVEDLSGNIYDMFTHPHLPSTHLSRTASSVFPAGMSSPRFRRTPARNLSSTPAAVWVFFITPDANGIHGEPEITGFPILGWEITLEQRTERSGETHPNPSVERSETGDTRQEAARHEFTRTTRDEGERGVPRAIPMDRSWRNSSTEHFGYEEDDDGSENASASEEVYQGVTYGGEHGVYYQCNHKVLSRFYLCCPATVSRRFQGHGC